MAAEVTNVLPRLDRQPRPPAVTCGVAYAGATVLSTIGRQRQGGRLPAMAKLLAYTAAEGLKVTVVLSEDEFDEFVDTRQASFTLGEALDKVSPGGPMVAEVQLHVGQISLPGSG